jgi:hypothetical protein
MSPAMISYLGTTLATGAAVPQVVSLAFPLPVSISGGIGGLAVAGTLADGAPNAGQFPVTIAGLNRGTGNIQSLSVDATGVLNVALSGGGTVSQGPGNVANPWTVQGPVASGVALSGNPLRAGAAFNTTPPTVASGQVVDLQANNHGFLHVDLCSTLGTGIDGQSNGQQSTISNNSTGAGQGPMQTAATIFNGTTWDRWRASNGDAQSNIGLAAAANVVFNGSTWDRWTKPRTAFRLPSSAASNNAANIKASPGTVFQISGNVTLAASVCYLKLFDGTGVPNPAAVNPLYFFALNIVNGFLSLQLPPQGLFFPTGIGMAIVANPADLDNTAIAAGQVTALNISFA